MQPDVLPRDAFLVGERRAYLRALRDEDADGPYAGWFENNAEVCRANSHHVFPYTKQAALDYIRDVRSRRDCLVLAMAAQEGDRHVGNISLQAIDNLYRSAEFAVVIGDKAAWERATGARPVCYTVRHGFEVLNLHRIYCGTFETNKEMRHLAEQLGMREEGRRRESAFKDGKFIDVVEYGVLRSEFDARAQATIQGRSDGSAGTPRR